MESKTQGAEKYSNCSPCLYWGFKVSENYRLRTHPPPLTIHPPTSASFPLPSASKARPSPSLAARSRSVARSSCSLSLRSKPWPCASDCWVRLEVEGSAGEEGIHGRAST